MTNAHFTKFESFLSENPGSTAKEIGLTSVEANRLEKSGRIVRVGERQTGKAGRRPVEYALPGQEGVRTDDRVLEAQERAKAKVAAHAEHEKLASAMWRLRDQHGLVAAKQMPEYQDLAARKQAIRDAHGGKIPPMPTAIEMTLAGVQTVGAPIEITDED